MQRLPHRPGAATAILTAATAAVALSAAEVRAEDPMSVVTFDCQDDRSIEATFHTDEVDLKLSDGRSLSLPQTISGSGIRYANDDETFVFWSKGDTAFVTEGADDRETFADCVAAK